MKKADFEARVKRIEITNRAIKNGWRQAIRLVLDDIGLSDENLLELRQFRPCESVIVTIEPAALPTNESSEENFTPLVEIFEDGAAAHQGRVIKVWNFENV